MWAQSVQTTAWFGPGSDPSNVASATMFAPVPLNVRRVVTSAPNRSRNRSVHSRVRVVAIGERRALVRSEHGLEHGGMRASGVVAGEGTGGRWRKRRHLVSLPGGSPSHICEIGTISS